jgi:hypothetical protein
MGAADAGGAAAPKKPSERNRPTEVIRRGAPELAADLMDNDADDTAAMAPRPIHDPLEDDDPSVPSAKSLAIAAESAHGGARGTQIVRGKPVPDPALVDQAESGGEAYESVDEALSVLAWLQSRQAEQGSPDRMATKPASAATPERTLDLSGQLVNEPIPQLKSNRGPMILVFAAGLVLGAVLTLGGQMLSGTEPASELDGSAEIAAATPDDAEPEAEAPEGLVEPPSPAEPEDAPSSSPDPVEVAPVELVAPPPPPRPARLDILYPRGARVRVDGRLLNRRVPIRGIELSEGNHSIRVFKRGYKKAVTFKAANGELFELKKKLRKKD